MLLTREYDYAVRIMRALSDGKMRPVSEISKMEEITVQHTYKIARLLEKAGLIETHRGVNGGYSLNADLSQVSLYDILEAVDQKVLVSNCTGCEVHCDLNPPERPCLVHKEFMRMQEMVDSELKQTMLDTLVYKEE